MKQRFWNQENIPVYENAIEMVVAEIRRMDEDYYRNRQTHLVRFMEQRLKTEESIRNKLKRKKHKVKEVRMEDVIHDLAGVRVVCYDTEQIYRIARMIGECEAFEIIKIKDYVRKRKENGYQSYHIIMKVGEVKVELQIRTILMDAWASLETILAYKKKTPISKELKSDIRKYANWSRKMDQMVARMLEHEPQSDQDEQLPLKNKVR